MIADFLRIAFLGGMLAVDRGAGWNLMISQPLVGACIAGLLVHPDPDWERWALRIPIAVGALLQLLLTNAALPAAQKSHDTATAGVVGSTVAVLGMAHLHSAMPSSAAGLLWVLLGVLAGLLAAVIGGWVQGLNRAAAVTDARRAVALAADGDAAGYDGLYIWSLIRMFTLGALWSWCGSLAFLAVALAVLPRFAELITVRRIGFVFAVLLGGALAAAYETHVRGVKGGLRWTAAGAAAAVAMLLSLASEGA
ncbi:MAG TPA: hypothetical protein VFU59_00480 [Candidatus Eisenbacteria bacterium]|nr:hypothetical protein [Candidatus Eisenbacteria bacterium]